MRRPVLALVALLAPGCTETPDPCAGHELACLAVTIENGPKELYQLLVSVQGYSSTTPLTPRRRPEAPLAYPLRFAIRFSAFDRTHKGQVTLEVSGLDGDNTVVGSVRQVVAIDNMEKARLSLSLGPPFDMADPADLTQPVDPGGDQRVEQDLGGDLAQGGSDLADGAGGG